MPAFYMNRKKPWNLSASPYACALLSGSEDYPGLRGKMEFYLSPPGLLITHDLGAALRYRCLQPLTYSAAPSSGGSCAP